MAAKNPVHKGVISTWDNACPAGWRRSGGSRIEEKRWPEKNRSPTGRKWPSEVQGQSPSKGSPETEEFLFKYNQLVDISGSLTTKWKTPKTPVLETGNQYEQRQRHLWKYHTTTRRAEMGPELNRPLRSTYEDYHTHIQLLFKWPPMSTCSGHELSMIIIIIITFIVHINITVPR